MDKSNSKPRGEWKEDLRVAAQHERLNRYGQLEELSGPLIDELLTMGHKHAVILAAKRTGMLYSRKLNTFVWDVDSPEFAHKFNW